MTVMVLVHGQFFARKYCLNSLCMLFRYGTCAGDHNVGGVIWTVVNKNVVILKAEADPAVNMFT